MKSEPALYELDFEQPGFSWIDCNDRDASLLSFVRHGKRENQRLVVACNFTPVPREDFRLGVPQDGTYRELLNSDSSHYGGANVGNSGSVAAEKIPVNGHPYSLQLVIPPLAAVILKRDA